MCCISLMDLNKWSIVVEAQSLDINVVFSQLVAPLMDNIPQALTSDVKQRRTGALSHSENSGPHADSSPPSVMHVFSGHSELMTNLLHTLRRHPALRANPPWLKFLPCCDADWKWVVSRGGWGMHVETPEFLTLLACPAVGYVTVKPRQWSLNEKDDLWHFLSSRDSHPFFSLLYALVTFHVM